LMLPHDDDDDGGGGGDDDDGSTDQRSTSRARKIRRPTGSARPQLRTKEQIRQP
jgi:hypothetical protein